VTARSDGRGHLAELLRAGVFGASSGVPARRRDHAGGRPGIVWRRHAIARRAARSGPVSDAAVVESRSRSFARDLIALTKPRIISLLLVTTIAPMFVAGRPAWTLVLAVFVGGYLMAGGANAVNMYIDRDIDDRMSRTRLRPIPSGRMQPREVLAFGVLLSTAAVWLFAAAANVLTAALALAGFYFYVFVYTRWLKRSTPQNIVIGGAAGAFPPLVGWAAVTGRVDLLAVFLFLIVFYWTPPHFWALALYRTEDYSRAGIPMLPVVNGDASTRRQILLYTLVLVPLGISPWLLGYTGAIYGTTAIFTGAIMMTLAWQVLRERRPAERASRNLFAFSILYLFLLFAVLLVERGWGGLIARLAT